MYISPKASPARQREAQKARDNRAEIVKALSHGQITRRDLYKWGIFTATGALALKNGLSPFAMSALAAVPTGTPRSPLFAAQKFSQPMPRLALQTPIPLTRDPATRNAVFPAAYGERPGKRLSYHTDYSANPSDPQFRNLVSGRGPIEGRPPGEIFAHQRWDEFFPKVGYVMSLGQIAPNSRFHPNFPAQNPNSVELRNGPIVSGTLPAAVRPLRRADPHAHHNNLPVMRRRTTWPASTRPAPLPQRRQRRREDGAATASLLARSTTTAGAPRSRGGIRSTRSDDRRIRSRRHGGLVNVPGDFASFRGRCGATTTASSRPRTSTRAHRHGELPAARTAENESLADGVNLRRRAAACLTGAHRFDVNLIVPMRPSARRPAVLPISSPPTVPWATSCLSIPPTHPSSRLPRKYASAPGPVAVLKLALAGPTGAAVRSSSSPTTHRGEPDPPDDVDHQGIAERYDIIVDSRASGSETGSGW